MMPLANLHFSRIDRKAFVALAMVIFAERAIGFDIDALSMEVAPADYVFIAAILLGLTIILGLWSAGGVSMIRRVLQGPRAENLFLTVSLQNRSDKSSASQAHIRSLDLNSATIVSYQRFKKGDSIMLELGSLPEFHGHSREVFAKVIHAETVRGDPPSYILDLEWEPLPENSQRDLSQYIENLTGERSLAPG